MLPQRMKKAITDNPKKLADLIDFVNLPSTLREFVGQSQISFGLFHACLVIHQGQQSPVGTEPRYTCCALILFLYQASLTTMLGWHCTSEEAGCFSVVLECVLAPVVGATTSTLQIPTIGIGTRPFYIGQVN
ncbi:hypothetical protein CsSME_00028485 [Camellia sinensis var. sinensis]